MTVLSYFKFLFRLYRPANGTLKAAFMALREAIKPLPF